MQSEGMPRTSQTMDNQVATTVPEVQPNPIAPILPPSTPGPSSASGTHRDKLVVIAKEKIAKELRQPRTIKRALRIPNKEIKQSTSMNDVPTSTITLSSSSDDEDVTCLSPKTFKSMDSFGETKASKLFLCRKYKPNKKGSLAVDFQPARKTFREGDFLQVHLKKSVLMRLDQLDMSCVHDEPRCPKLGSKPATGSSDNDDFAMYSNHVGSYDLDNEEGMLILELATQVAKLTMENIRIKQQAAVWALSERRRVKKLLRNLFDQI